MANFCYTNYVVEGKLEALQQLRDVINEVNEQHKDDGKFNVGYIFVALGLYDSIDALAEVTKDYYEDSPEGLGIYGSWSEAKVEEINGQTVLTFHEEYRWNCGCNMETLCKLDSFKFKSDITAVYRYSEEPGCGIYETTDKERKYFTDEYIKSLGYEPEEIMEASGMTAGQYRKIAHQIVEENFARMKAEKENGKESL